MTIINSVNSLYYLYNFTGITDLAKFKSLLIDQVNRNFANLHAIFSYPDTLGTFAKQLFENGMISSSVKSNPDFDAIMKEIVNSLRFKRKTPVVTEHCRKFFRIMSEIGPSQKDAACSIAEDMEEVILKEFNVTVKFSEQ